MVATLPFQDLKITAPGFGYVRPGVSVGPADHPEPCHSLAHMEKPTMKIR